MNTTTEAESATVLHVLTREERLRFLAWLMREYTLDEAQNTSVAELVYRLEKAAGV